MTKPHVGPIRQPYGLIGTPEPLTRYDLAALVEAPPGSRLTTSLTRLRASHHNIARYAAYGFSNREIAAQTGYTRERVGQLLGNPAMEELVATYRSRIEEREADKLDAYLDLKAKNMIAAERHISDSIAELDDAGELLPLKTALAISADGADRLGYSKRQVTTINHEFASALEKAIRRSGKLVDITPVATVEPPRLGSSQEPPTLPAETLQRPLIRRRA